MYSTNRRSSNLQIAGLCYQLAARPKGAGQHNQARILARRARATLTTEQSGKSEVIALATSVAQHFGGMRSGASVSSIKSPLTSQRLYGEPRRISRRRS